jgi:uncharacterized metal-binding protein
MSGKKLLILERSNSNLNYTTDKDGSITLEGVFTEFGVRNKNNRIYEEKEVMPHINELKEKVKTNKLLGELDHPKDFDVSLSNVSHVVEDLTYDADNKQVVGKIRLLNTSKGKEAQALIKDGIPLHISSRAAGTVDENGKVKIKKFFTYDLVADPGFENAELSRVNESFGFENDNNLLIYEMESTKENNEDIKKEDLTMENNNFVTVEDFQKYTEYVQGVLNGVKESSSSNETETVDKLIKYSEHIAEKVNQISDYTEYLAENIDKGISYSDYLAENMNKIKDYTTYLAEELDTSIQYAEHVAEKADQGIQYSNYVAENLDNGIKYSEYVAEKVDQNIAYSEYLSENLDKNIKYSEYIAEKVNTEDGEAINEELKGHAKQMKDDGASDEEIKKMHPEVSDEDLKEEENYKETIDEKLNALIAKAEAKVVNEMHFMNFLTESKKNQFKELSEDKQKSIVESMNAKPIMSTVQADNVWESNFIEKPRELNIIDDMPEKYKERWSNLSENRQKQIIAESKFHKTETQYAINNFWATRDLRNTQVDLESINESKTAAEASQTKEPLVNESFKNDLVEKMRFRLNR